MAVPILGVMVFVVALILAVVLFTGWILLTVIRTVWRALFGVPAASRSFVRRGTLDTRMCARDRCHATNPVHAQFCRRCGGALDGISNAGRRAAV